MSEKEETGKEASGGRLTGEDILSEERCSRWKEPQAACCSSHVFLIYKLHLFFSDGSCMCVFCAIIQGFDLCLTPCQGRIITISNSTKNQDLTLQN